MGVASESASHVESGPNSSVCFLFWLSAPCNMDLTLLRQLVLLCLLKF